MRVKLHTWTLMMLFLSGVISSNWKVEYQHKLICAVKGSTVSIPCLFYSPDNQTVQRLVWGHVKSPGKRKIISLGKSGKVTRGFQYIGDKLHNCSLKIHQVGHSHAGKYMVMFSKAKRLPVGVAPSLNVADLTISMTKSSRSEVIKEGDSVNLTCVNSCDDINASSAFTWFKNGQSTYEGPFLYLRNMSPTVSGNYACSLRTYPGTISRAVHIDVEYSPRNTSLIVRPPAAGAGSNFTLICSTNANPPVENYTWFKTGGEEIPSVGHQLIFSPADGGEYFCSAANKHGSQNSSTVVLNTGNDHETFSRGALVIAAVGAFLIVITIILVIRICKKRMRPTSTACDEDEPNSDYVNWLTSETIQLQDGHLPEWGAEEVCYTTVVFPNKRRGSMEQQADFHHEDVTYNSVG